MISLHSTVISMPPKALTCASGCMCTCAHMHHTLNENGPVAGGPSTEGDASKGGRLLKEVQVFTGKGPGEKPACGGLMMAENSVMPYMPRLEMEKVPPVNSCGFSLPAFAYIDMVHRLSRDACLPESRCYRAQLGTPGGHQLPALHVDAADVQN